MTTCAICQAEINPLKQAVVGFNHQRYHIQCWTKQRQTFDQSHHDE